MNGFLGRNWRTLLGAALGALGGGLYAHFIGCKTGTCALTSNVWTSALFFGFTGAIALTPSAKPRKAEPEAPQAR
jgi:uncharacterized protein YcfJ